MWDDLVCPTDRGRLLGFRDWLACQSCGRGYPVLDSIPTFLAPREDPRWQLLQAQRIADLPAQSDEAAPERSTQCRQRARALEDRLARFLELSPASKVLQVGIRGEAELHHFRSGVRYGVEPLAGVLAERGLLKWGQVRWVAGRGEELPFPDRNFQLILLGDILDKVESPRRVLAEAARCLADDGVLWISSRVRRAGWLGSLRRRLARDGGAAAGRLREFTARELAGLCRSARLKTLAACWAPALPLANDATRPPHAAAAVSDCRGEWLLAAHRGRVRPITLPAATAQVSGAGGDSALATIR
jgi:SAM-dependent methyltransferase